jgi:hypothetical protein
MIRQDDATLEVGMERVCFTAGTSVNERWQEQK